MMIRTIAGVLGLWVLAAGAAAAQSARQDKKPVDMKITELKGTVDVKRPGDKAWGKGSKDMMLPAKSEIATGLKSSVTLTGAGRIKIVLQSVSYLKLTSSSISKIAASTKLDLKYGVLDINVKRTAVRADLSVRSPNATTSVSGTGFRCIALGKGVNPRGRVVNHAITIVREGIVAVAKNVPGGLIIAVGEREALAMAKGHPFDHRRALGDTAGPPIELWSHEGGIQLQGSIADDTQTLGDPFGGLTIGSATSGNDVVSNQEGATDLPGPPAPPTNP